MYHTDKYEIDAKTNQNKIGNYMLEEDWMQNLSTSQVENDC